MNQKVSLVLIVFAVLAALVGGMTYMQAPGSISAGVFIFPALLAVFLVVQLLRKK